MLPWRLIPAEPRHQSGSANCSMPQKIADFVDALIAGTNVARGCTKTVTFDRKAAKKVAHFVAL
jgi:predicted nucleic-acid-binding protein